MDPSDNRPQSWLPQNLELLRSLQPDLAKTLEAGELTGRLEAVSSRTGLPVLVKEGVSLHSRHDPQAEASAFLDSDPVREALSDGRSPLVFGLGLGYHVRALLERFPRLYVYEPDLEVILAALSFFDWRPLMKRLNILTGTNRPPVEGGSARPLLVHRPTERLEPAACSRVRARLEGLDRDPKELKPGSSWKIMVVTPLSGGSLPVAGHVIRALKSLGHEVVEADMAGLGPYYDRMMQAQAPTNRRDEVGKRLNAFCGEYLVYLAEVEKPDLVLALAQAPLDSNSLARIRRLGIPLAFWFVEDFRFLYYFKALASSYDYFFHIQGQEMEQALKASGCPRFARLPLAADPDLFCPVRDADLLSPYRAELSFMGAAYPNREKVFRALLDYDLTIWGSGWDLKTELGSRVRENGRRVSTEETVLIFNAAEINLNLHSSVFVDDLDLEGGFVNPRTFEIASCGCFQLVDLRPPLPEFFEPGRELAVFAGREDLREQVEYYRARPELRLEIGAAARERVLAEHTYQHRMASLLEFIADNPA